MQQHHLRNILSEELHTRPFHDFEGGGRFIRLVYLHEQSEQAILRAVNSWLKKQSRPVIASQENSGVSLLTHTCCGLSGTVNSPLSALS